ncbi:MAG: hypothetical protein IT582_02290 [Opitutaceae bacterium]|nr:hypothetical protein [Opitutaceae bacterium]
MRADACYHLDRDARVKLGAFYTPADLVDRVHALVAPHLARAGGRGVLLDSAAGYGAFLQGRAGALRAGEIDEEAVARLRATLPGDAVFPVNALQSPHRARYGITDDAPLIVVGNPPYNDTTSEFRKGQKGGGAADPDLAERDLGISFLRSYARLRADVVCVLHPLSYLIKRANFARLREFAAAYRLRRGLLFSSARFGQTGGTKFPVVMALYERGEPMDYDGLRRFEFELLDGPGAFRLDAFTTTDGLINKYPVRKSGPQTSDLGLYHYTFRDINSLRRNAGFLAAPHYNGIVVMRATFHHYAYLHAFKSFFAPANLWLYGNLSPLVDPAWLEAHRRDLVAFALTDHPVLRNADAALRATLARDHGLAPGDLIADPARTERLRAGIMRLARV